jgi:hypothetical protein
MRTNNPGHLASFDYLGLSRYFLTFCVNDRRKVFMHEAVVMLTLQQILRAATENGLSRVHQEFEAVFRVLLLEGVCTDSVATLRVRTCSSK